MREPSLTLRARLTSVFFSLRGSSSSTPYWRASLIRSACRRAEYTGLCQRPVSSCLDGWNGLCVSAWKPVCTWGAPTPKSCRGGYRARNFCSLSGSVLARPTNWWFAAAAVGSDIVGERIEPPLLPAFLRFAVRVCVYVGVCVLGRGVGNWSGSRRCLAWPSLNSSRSCASIRL